MPPQNGTLQKALFVVLSVLTTIALALGAFSLKFQFEAHAKHSVMEENVERLMADTHRDEKQDRSVRKHWKLHTWARDRITELRHVHGLPLEPWPDLDVD
jgi:hypothetical protein